ncbi:MAG: class I SAM-dependent methyltransferase [Candidatus Xenobiia bacterium LiM19]
MNSNKTDREKNKCCNDKRCLFYSSYEPQQSNFTTVTEEVREGKGLWERCERCGLVINRTGVEPSESNNFYNTEYIKDNSYSKGSLLSAREHFEERLPSIKVIADFLKQYLRNDMKVLEVGAATGELLYLIKNDVKECYGIEINELFSDFIQLELGIKASHTDYLKIDYEEKFDMIIAVNTIDHIYDILATVEKMYWDLNEGGYLYLEVPNDNQALKEYLPEPQRKRFRQFMYQKAHYYSFTFDTLRRLLLQHDFNILHEESRHDYSILNYMNWYFLGEPQTKLKTAMLSTDVHIGNTPFENSINSLFAEFNESFKNIMRECMVGETLCILAKK